MVIILHFLPVDIKFLFIESIIEIFLISKLFNNAIINVIIPIKTIVHIITRIGYLSPDSICFPQNTKRVFTVPAKYPTTLEPITPKITPSGTDIIYIAYQDVIGQYRGSQVLPQDGILWIDEIGDVQTCFSQIRKGTISIKEIIHSYKGKKVYAISAWEDPLPLFFSILGLIGNYLKRIFSLRNWWGHK